MRTEEYIPKRVKELCSKHKVSKYRLAQLTDMSQTALANIMNKKSIPTVPTLERICDAFGISIAQFFAGDGMRPDLTDEQGELLEIWDDLNADERKNTDELRKDAEKVRGSSLIVSDKAGFPFSMHSCDHGK